MKIKREKIVDLSFLKGTDISELEIDAPGIKNITALNGNKSLEKLSINFGTSGRGFKEIKMRGLKSLPSLKSLELGEEVKSIDFVKGLENLEYLAVEGCVSLKGIEGLSKLREIELRCRSLKSIQPIETLKLNSLRFFVFSFNEKILEELYKIIESGVVDEVSIDKCRNLYNENASRPMEFDISKSIVSKFKKLSGVKTVDYNHDGYFGDSMSIYTT